MQKKCKHQVPNYFVYITNKQKKREDARHKNKEKKKKTLVDKFCHLLVYTHKQITFKLNIFRELTRQLSYEKKKTFFFKFFMLR
jgi:hypothetical protein